MSITQTQATLDRLNGLLEELKTRSSIEVNDTKSYVDSAAVKLDLEAFIKTAKHVCDEELLPAEEKVKRIKLQLSVWINPAQTWLENLNERRKAWVIKERTESTTTGMGDTIPLVPGTRTPQTKYGYEKTDESAIPPGYWVKVLDDKKIMAEIEQYGFKTDIPGIKVVLV